MKKNLPKTIKKDLQFLIERFLEKFTDKEEIAAAIGGNGDAAKILWEKLERPLFGDIHWMDEVAPEDIAETDYEELLIRYHDALKPTWDLFREAIFDFKYRIIPEREGLADLRNKFENDALSILHEYKDLLDQGSVIDWEKMYDIELKIRVSFDPGHVAFYKRKLDVFNNFLDLLQGVPIKYFAKCNHCGKCIIRTRSNKRYCPGCAAKKYQKDKWASDPEGMKAKEKLRYAETRKKN